ncbi:unnamed protein product [Cylindrotheca closterium]|uniref:Plastid division protein FtsZ n=1 Tax=Cylindrotheca closterium TaxID=2856 RepID=A0AAD2CT98_9STRA|nr:unnamed protein product [Cylindrotheca closterium]
MFSVTAARIVPGLVSRRSLAPAMQQIASFRFSGHSTRKQSNVADEQLKSLMKNKAKPPVEEKPKEEKPIEFNETLIRKEETFPVDAALINQFAPKIKVIGVGGAGGNALNNMVTNKLKGVEFAALNTDAQHLATSRADTKIQIGAELTKGLGCGANPDAGRMAAEESREEIKKAVEGSHLVFITAGMGGGTGTGAAPVIADICYEMDIMTIGVVTMPFNFEGTHRRRLALEGIDRLAEVVDTLIVIPNQNLFEISGPETTFADAFQMADDVLLGGVKTVSELMTSPGIINLDFADVRSVMSDMGNAIMGTGVSDDPEDRAIKAAEQALGNPLLGLSLDISSAKGVLVNISGGSDMTLYEVDRAAQLITGKVADENANIIFGSTHDKSLEGKIRVSLVATGIDRLDYY